MISRHSKYTGMGIIGLNNFDASVGIDRGHRTGKCYGWAIGLEIASSGLLL